VGSYTIKETVSANVIKLKLLESIGIHLVINISRVVRYKELMKGYKVEEPELIKIDEVEEGKVARIINKRVEQECVDLENTKEIVIVSQTSFNLYLHNQWTDFHKLSYAEKPQMRAICTYMECTKAITND